LPSPTQTIGKHGELLAANWLRANGYKIITQNAFYRGGELDFVTRNAAGKLVVFEVKARRSGSFGSAIEAITAQKLRRLHEAIFSYLQQHGSGGEDWQLDLLAVELRGGTTQIEHISHINEY